MKAEHASNKEIFHTLHPNLLIGLYRALSMLSALPATKTRGAVMQEKTILRSEGYNAFGGQPHHGNCEARAGLEASRPRLRKENLLSFGPSDEAFDIVAVEAGTALWRGDAA